MIRTRNLGFEMGRGLLSIVARYLGNWLREQEVSIDPGSPEPPSLFIVLSYSSTWWSSNVFASQCSKPACRHDTRYHVIRATGVRCAAASSQPRVHLLVHRTSEPQPHPTAHASCLASCLSVVFPILPRIPLIPLFGTPRSNLRVDGSLPSEQHHRYRDLFVIIISFSRWNHMPTRARMQGRPVPHSLRTIPVPHAHADLRARGQDPRCSSIHDIHDHPARQTSRPSVHHSRCVTCPTSPAPFLSQGPIAKIARACATRCSRVFLDSTWNGRVRAALLHQYSGRQCAPSRYGSAAPCLHRRYVYFWMSIAVDVVP